MEGREKAETQRNQNADSGEFYRAIEEMSSEDTGMGTVEVLAVHHDFSKEE